MARLTESQALDLRDGALYWAREGLTRAGRMAASRTADALYHRAAVCRGECFHGPPLEGAALLVDTLRGWQDSLARMSEAV